MRAGGFDIDILVQGYPGKTVCHGGLGWSTVALIRGRGRVVLVDAGSFNMRRLLVDQLARFKLTVNDVTDVILTHAHYDHSINWVMFPRARILIGGDELSWATAQPIGHALVPEFYVRELAVSQQLHRMRVGEEILPGMTAYDAPGHTPGHLIFYLSTADTDVLFTGDAAKNRAELVSRAVDMTMDERASQCTIARIWDLWARRPGTILVPGHDIPMVLEEGNPKYLEPRRGGITAWFGDTLDQTMLFELSRAPAAGRT